MIPAAIRRGRLAPVEADGAPAAQQGDERDRADAGEDRYGTWSPAASASRALPPSPTRLAGRPREVHEREREALRDARRARRRRSASPSRARRACRSPGRRARSATPSAHADSGHGRSSIDRPPPATPIRLGTSRPRRSDSRPISGATTPRARRRRGTRRRSRRVPAPSSSSRSGPSTADGPEQQARQRREPHAGRDAAVASEPISRAQRRAAPRLRCRHPQRPHDHRRRR